MQEQIRVRLRGVEPRDVDLMYSVENDLRNWSESGATQPFSRYLLELFVESQSDDIFKNRQLRLMVEGADGETVGMVDLFEFDPVNHRAGVGIYIMEPFRGGGYGVAALEELHKYCRGVLQLHQLWCGVAVDNIASYNLFRSMEYRAVGVKREWLWREDGYCDEVMMQYVFD
ncbi:MAG: GNAT family protein [Rikenellaceae bacterium]